MGLKSKYPLRLRRLFSCMKQRCYNPNIHSYKTYGGKGITICDEWLKNPNVFYEWAMNNGYDENAEYQQCTIDRINNSKGYSPDNCRFISNAEQARNKSTNVCFELDGKKYCIVELAEMTGLKYGTLSSRLRHSSKPFEELLENKNLNENLYTYRGKTQNLAQWAKELNINYGTLRSRIFDSNMSVEDAFKFKNLRDRPINQFTLDGEYLATYKNARVAQAATGADYRNIFKVCNHSRNSAYGYKWSYADE